MRNLILAVAIMACLSPVLTKAEPAQYDIDPSHLTVAFKVDHVGYFDMIGLFTRGEGSFNFDDQALTVNNIKIVIETDSVFTGHRKRDNHLKGADFLNSREFPEMVFVGKSSEKTGAKTGKIHGELTLLGVTRPLTLDVTWNKSAIHPIYKVFTVGVSAAGTLKRSEYGMNYAVKNGWVGDDIHLIIGFEAQKR